MGYSNVILILVLIIIVIGTVVYYKLLKSSDNKVIVDTTIENSTENSTEITPSNTVSIYDSYKSSDYMIKNLNNTNLEISSNNDGVIGYSFKGNEFNVCSDASTCGGIKITENIMSLGDIQAEQICFGDICIKQNDINVKSDSLGTLVRTTIDKITNITFDSDRVDVTNDSIVELMNYNLQKNVDGKILSRILVNPGVEIRNFDAGGKILNSFKNDSSKPIIILNSNIYGMNTTNIAEYIPDDIDIDSIYIAPLDNTITAFFT